MAKRIAGSGGGRQSAPAPAPQPVVQQTVVVQAAQRQDDANSLFSKSSIRLIDLISEGEIEGFVESDARKSIFFDDTVLRNSDDSDNFTYDDFETRLGTQSQDYIPGFASSENAVNVNAAVGDAVDDSVVRTITDADVDAVNVRISIGQLFRVDNGLKATSLGYAIDVQADGGGYVEKLNTSVNGKCTSAYERSHRIELTGDAPWDIRLRRVSGINDNTNNVRLLSFAGFTEIIDAKLRYPLSAMVGLRFDASQFAAIPTRAYDIKGIKVQIPSNGTVRADGSISYSGVWDGTFQVAWTADPAWILRDLVTSSRYGLGRFVTSAQVDKWTLYEISKYASAQIADGEGGTESRFLCNVYLQTREEAYSVVQDFCSCFRGMAYWSAGQLAFTQDSPKDPAALFSNSNVIEGIFNYQGSSLKARHTVALVTWNDPEQAYQQRVEYVSDEDAIAKYGIIEVRMAAFACTSRGQANRLGRWLLYSEQQESDTVSFTVGLDGAIVRPGQIIKVADQMRAGSRKGGRIASATTTVLTIDQSIAVSPGDDISVVMPDGRVEQREIDSADFDDKTITVSTAFSVAPQAQSIFVIETSDVEAQLFRVLSVTEDGENYKITALEHNDGKYAHIEDGLTLQQRDITLLNQKPAAPQNINVDERLVEAGNRVTTEIEIAWANVDGATGYQVSFKTENSLSFFTVGDTPYNSLTFNTDDTGEFTFRVVAISALGKRSDPAELSQSIAGNTAAPAAVSGLSMVPVNGQAKLTWTQAADLDVRVGGYVLLRHSPELTGVTWANSTSIGEQIAGSSTEAYADLKPGTYSAKFVDSGGRQSLTATLIEFTKPDLENLENINTQTEHTAFSGTKTQCVVNASLGELQLDYDGGSTSSAGRIVSEDDSGITLEDDDDNLGQEGDDTFHTSATYEFNNNPITLSDVFSVQLESELLTRSFFPYNQRIDDIDDFDEITDFDGTTPQKTDVQLYVRTTQDDPSGTPTWTSWRKFNNAQFKARAYELKAELTTDTNVEQVAIQELEVTSNMPYRTITDSVTTSSSADVSVSFANKFAATPQIGIGFTTQASGDYYVISNSSATGFDVSVYNSSDVRQARTIRWTATGYGKG